MKRIFDVMSWLSIAFAAFTLIYLVWVLTSRLNYALTYEPMVKSTVCEMVKPENLINECGKKDSR